jgi:acetylornithine/succinyldiaminopimelate/putrescine aminotransferase
MKAVEHIEITEKCNAHNDHPIPVVPSHGEGTWVADAGGKKYIDFLAGYSALNLGHHHPTLVEMTRLGMLNALDFEKGVEAWDVCLRPKGHGILARQTHGNIIRFTPPLVITKGEIDLAVQRIGESL